MLGLGLSLNRVVSFASGVFKSLCSFLFDGVDDYFIIDDASPTIANATEGTWLASVYINTAAPSVAEAIIAFGSSGATVEYIYMYLRNDGTIRIDAALGGVNCWNLITTNPVFTDNTWHTIALVQDGVSPELYIDGVLVAHSFLVSVDTTVWFNDYASLNLGTLGALRYDTITDSFFSGVINQVGLLNTDISAAQILEWHNENEPLSAKKLFPANIAYFWVPQDALAFDTVNSEWAIPNSIDPPTFNKGFEFDKIATTRFNLDEALPSLATTTTGTWLMFMKFPLSIPTTNETMVSFGDVDGHNLITIFLKTNGLIRVLYISGGVTLFDLDTDSAPISDDTWHSVALVQDGVAAVIYVDGVAVAQAFTISTDTSVWINDIPTLDNIRIGSTNYNSAGDASFSSNTYNQVALLDTNLSAAQILNWDNSGNPLDASISFPDNIVYNWVPQEALSFDALNTEWAVPNAANPPTLTKAIVFDGIGDYAWIPGATLSPILSGASPVFSISMFIKVGILGTTQQVFVNWGAIVSIIIEVPATRLLSVTTADGVGQGETIIASVADELLEGTLLTFTFDGSRDLGDRTRIFIGGEDKALSTSTAPEGINDPGVQLYTVMGDAATKSTLGDLQGLFITDTFMSLAEHQSVYNSRNYLSPIDVLGADCKLCINSTDAAWNGSKYIINDAVNSIDLTTQNVIEAGFKYRSPNLSHSINFIEDDLKYRASNLSYSSGMDVNDKDCAVNPY